MSKQLLFSLLLIVGTLLHGQSIDEARKLVSYGQYAKAAQVLEDLVKANPTNIQHQLWLGDVYAREGKDDKAMETWKAASSNLADNYGLIAAGRVQLPVNATEAQKLFDKAIKNTKSKDARIIQAVGESYLFAKNKQPDLAIEYLNKALAVDRSDASIFISLAEAQMAKRDAGSAMTNYEYAAEKALNKAEAYFKIGDLYMKAKNQKLGLDFLEKARQADPGYPQVYKEMGDYYFENTNENVKAVENYEKYLSFIEPTKDDLARYANALNAAGQYERSIQVINDILKTDPSSVYLYKVISQSYHKLDQPEKGLDYMNKYMAGMTPDKILPADYMSLANIHRKMGADSLALVNFAKAYEADNKEVELLDSIISILTAQKKYPETIKYYTIKANLPGAGAMDFFNLGRSYYLTKDFANADSAFRRIIALRPDVATGYLWSAKCNAKLDPELITEAAVPQYEKFIEIAFANVDTYRKELGEAYGYLAYYQYAKLQDITKAKEMAQKAVDIDPTNAQAGEMLKAMQ